MPDEVRTLISEDALARRVAELARQICADHAGQRPILIGVLKGAWVFLADLARHMTLPVRCDFIKVSSYGSGTTSTGEVRLDLDVTLPLAGQPVVLVEDIVDTGRCFTWLAEHLRQKGAASVKLCTLLDNPARRAAPVALDYVGFEIPNRFVIGYGIDVAEEYRHLPYIGYLESGREP